MTDKMDELMARAMRQSAAERKLLFLLAELIHADLIGRAGEFDDHKRAQASEIYQLMSDIENA